MWYLDDASHSEFELTVWRGRFPSVSMLFLGELEPVASGQVPKDADMKYENLVRGLKHVQIKVSRHSR